MESWVDRHRKIQQFSSQAHQSFELLASREGNARLSGFLNQERVSLQEVADDDLKVLGASCQLGGNLQTIVREKSLKLRATEEEAALQELLRNFASQKLDIESLAAFGVLSGAFSFCADSGSRLCSLPETPHAADLPQTDKVALRRRAVRPCGVTEVAQQSKTTRRDDVNDDGAEEEVAAPEFIRVQQAVLAAMDRRGEQKINFWRFALRGHREGRVEEAPNFSWSVEHIFYLLNCVQLRLLRLVDEPSTCVSNSAAGENGAETNSPLSWTLLPPPEAKRSISPSGENSSQDEEAALQVPLSRKRVAATSPSRATAEAESSGVELTERNVQFVLCQWTREMFEQYLAAVP